ncbi:MAG: Inner membrane protein, partial [uncultured Thiotrichaceae bacterium]
MQFFQPYTKLVFIFVLMLLLLMPQNSIVHLIKERLHWQTNAMQNIKQSWPGEQTLAGPFLRIPYTIEIADVKRSFSRVIMPDALNITTQLDGSERYRGIHKMPVYQTDIHVSGFFSNDIWANLHKEYATRKIDVGQASIEYYVSDQRGIQSQPVLDWNKKSFNFHANDVSNIGISSNLGTLDQTAKSYPFSFGLT